MNRLEEAIQKRERPLLGAAMYSYDPVFLEIVSHQGYDVLWIEMEHAFVSFAQAADICRMAAGSDLLTMIRIPDARRESVLKAAECGPDIIDLPMCESRKDARELTKHARFAPGGQRGYFSVSRALDYSLKTPTVERQQQLDRDLTLMIQIESRQAVDHIESLCSVSGVDAVLLGLGDLSTSLGVAGETHHPRVLEAASRVLATAAASGKHRVVVPSPDHFDYWTTQDIDLLFVCNNTSCLKLGAAHFLKQARQAVAGSGSRS